LPLIFLNQVGGQDELVFDGAAFVLNAKGETTTQLPAFQEAYSLVTFEQDGAWQPQPGDLATLPEGDEQVYQALMFGLREYVGKNGFPGVIIGLSGGIDSALTAALAVDALGPEAVQAVMMPYRYTTAMSKEDAELQATMLGVDYRVLPITPMVTAVSETLEDFFAGMAPDATEENIQARCRGLILMAISNKTGSMVLTTGNKSELSVGYATLYGDMSGGFAPLKDVSKTLVYRLCRYRNEQGAVIPQRVLTRPPTAELRPDQCDQDSLPDYAILDRVLELSVEQDMPMEDIIASTGFDREIVEQVIAMVQRNEYKRRQSAPGVRITRRAFGRDRRYPITSGYGRNKSS
jgi:NAD+ synthase (glutamine-hydrolysing)